MSVERRRDEGGVDVVVVGGGIGGLSNAVALSQKGYRVRVLERSSEFGEVGAGLQIAPNCTRILSHWGLLDEIKSLGVLVEHIIMRDAVDGTELTRLDLADTEDRYGFPYMVIHRSDLHGTLLRAAERLGVELVTNVKVTGYEPRSPEGAAGLSAGRRDAAPVVIAADGLHSVARPLFSDDRPVNSAYVAYRGAVPIDRVADLNVSTRDVVVYVGPKCHFVQYPLRQGEMFNQVAVFESPKAVALGDAAGDDWGTPDELDGAFADCCDNIRSALPLMWRDRWWRMFDRNPIGTWVDGRLALTGDAAHAPLQYLAQGAVMAMEDAYVLAEHAAARRGTGSPETTGGTDSTGGADATDWDATLAAYEAVRTEHCRRVVLTARSWGELWHHTGEQRRWRNEVVRARDVHDYSYVDWLYAPTALVPEDEPPMFPSTAPRTR